jgi:putative chitobiose transport system substrate-binding protein
VNPQARIVNAELLERGGLDAGTLAGDWRGLIGQAAEFKRRTGEFLFSQPLGEESQIPIMMLGEGLVPLREEGGRLVADLTRTEVVEYVRLWVGAYRGGWMPREAATKGHAHLTELYQEGHVAVINTGPNFVERIRDVAPKVFDRTMVLKGAVGELGRVHMPVMVLAVVSQSRHPEWAARLAWHLTGPEAELALSKLVAVMPSARAALDDPYFAEAVARSPEGVMAKDAEGRLLQARDG